MDRFVAQYQPDTTLLVGGDGIPLSEFLATPVTSWASPGGAAP